MVIDCPPGMVGLLIGKKGWTIKKIQQETGAQVQESTLLSVPRWCKEKLTLTGVWDAMLRVGVV